MRTDLDTIIDSMASRQHGVWTAEQLRRIGASRSYASQRVLRGVWQSPFPGIYAHRNWERSFKGQTLAAAWSMEDGLACLDSAAALLKIPNAAQGAVEILVQRGRSRTRPFRVHETTWLPDHHRTSADGVPSTTVDRTLPDLAPRWDDDRLMDAWSQCIDKRRTTADALERAAVPMIGRGHPGTERLRLMLAAHDETEPPAQSVLEHVLAEIVHVGGYGESVAQMPLDELCGLHGRVDRYLPAVRLVLEADGRSWHARVRDFERDHERDNALQAEGHHVARFTYHQLKEDRVGVIAVIDRHYIRNGFHRDGSGLWLRDAA